MERIEGFLKLIIVVIYGVVFGGGLEFVMVCYIRIVVEDVKLGLLEFNFGIILGFVGI